MSQEWLNILFSTIGIFGVSLILLAYFFIQTKRLTADHLKYQFLNIAGSLLLLVSLFWEWNTPSVVIQTCWIFISLYGITRIMKTRKEQPHDDQ